MDEAMMRQLGVGKPEKSYWVQSQAPAGNFSDVLGIYDGPGAEARAREALDGYRRMFPGTVYRVVVRTDDPVAI